MLCLSLERRVVACRELVSTRAEDETQRLAAGPEPSQITALSTQTFKCEKERPGPTFHKLLLPKLLGLYTSSFL